MTQHLGFRSRLRRSWRGSAPGSVGRSVTFADANHIPVVRFDKGDRKIEVMRPYLTAQARTGRSGVAAIGVAQEYQNVFAATQREDRGRNGNRSGSPSPRPTGGSPASTSTCGTSTSGRRSSRSAPTSRIRSRSGSTATSGPNGKPPTPGSGSPSCPTGSPPARTPPALQAICDRLGPGTIGVFFERWMSILPLPLTDADRAAGYWWELSMRQIEVSRTLVFDAPAEPGRSSRRWWPTTSTSAAPTRRADLRRPSPAVGDGRPSRPRTYKTQVVTRDTTASPSTPFYKHSRVKQYLKDGRALRIETVINSPDDLALQAPTAAPGRAAGQGP